MSVDNVEKSEAELDAEIIASIEKVKAGEELKPESSGATGPTGATEGAPETGNAPTGPTGATGEGETGTPQADESGKDDPFRVPNKGKFESDESYEKRIELFDLVKRRKAATTPEAKAALTKQIQDTKGELRNLNSGSQINNLTKPAAETKVEGEEDPNLAADRERLKELGGATKEDIQEVIRQERFVADQKSTLESFVGRHPQLKDEDMREVFFDYVDTNFLWQDKSGKALMTVLEMAAETMFKPSETIQERVLKGADVQEKVNAMQFPGSTGSGTGMSAEMRKSVEELKATGMSEEKALELLSDE